MTNQWMRIRVSELCDLIVDCVNKTAPHVDYKTPYKMIRTPNIKKGRVNMSGCRYVEEEIYEKWSRRAKVLEGDILLTREAPMGEVGLVNFNDTVFLGQRVMQYRANPEKLYYKFLLYSFLSPDLKYQFRRHDSSGSIVSHITVPDCLKFEINTPSLKEQKKIADTLSSIDQKIEINNRINAELEAMAKTLYDYWFVQFDFPDENGKPYKSSGGKMLYSKELKREIPAGWEAKKLKAVTSCIRRGVSPKYVEEGGIPVLNQKCIRDQKILFAEMRYHAGLLKDDDERLLTINDVLVNSTGVGTLGRVAFVKRLLESKTTVDSHVTIVRANSGEILPEFLSWTILRYQMIIESAANGSTGQVELNKSFLEGLDIIIPINNLQHKFKKIVLPLVTEVARRERENEVLVPLRDWLLPMLMNGQVRVESAADDLYSPEQGAGTRQV